MSGHRQLPAAANLRQLRIQAKDLRRAVREGRSDAVHRVEQTHPRFAGASHRDLTAANFTLADAQLVIARELGLESWPQLKTHVESLSQTALSLHALIAANNLEAVRETLKRNAESANQLNESGLPPLFTAALSHNQMAIDLLLANNANVDIFACAYLGRAADAVRLLSDHPELSRATTRDGMTALHYAAQAGHFDVVEVLRRYHADVNALDGRGETPLMAACHAGPWKSNPSEEVIQLLLDHGAKVDLFQAAALGQIELVESILQQDADLIDAVDDRGRTALFHAARNNRFSTVKFLIERGADVNRSDAVGIAALHRTSQQCSDELIQYLIDHGADAHLCCYVACGDENGTRQALARHPAAADEILYEFNAIGYAIHSWQLGTLRILLERGGSLSGDDRQQILRISGNDENLLGELLSIKPV